MCAIYVCLYVSSLGVRYREGDELGSHRVEKIGEYWRWMSDLGYGICYASLPVVRDNASNCFHFAKYFLLFLYFSISYNLIYTKL